MIILLVMLTRIRKCDLKEKGSDPFPSVIYDFSSTILFYSIYSSKK